MTTLLLYFELKNDMQCYVLQLRSSLIQIFNQWTQTVCVIAPSISLSALHSDPDAVNKEGSLQNSFSKKSKQKVKVSLLLLVNCKLI